MTTYTVEEYRPAYPARGTRVAVHVGEFEMNRDTLSPGMIRTLQIRAATALGAIRSARFYWGLESR